jgi:hypothetical protein
MNTPQQLLNIGFITAMCTERALAAAKVADSIDTKLHPELRDVAEELLANADAFYAIVAFYRAHNTTPAKQPPMIERLEAMKANAYDAQDRAAHGAASVAKKGGV